MKIDYKQAIVSVRASSVVSALSAAVLGDLCDLRLLVYLKTLKRRVRRKQPQRARRRETDALVDKSP